MEVKFGKATLESRLYQQDALASRSRPPQSRWNVLSRTSRATAKRYPASCQ